MADINEYLDTMLQATSSSGGEFFRPGSGELVVKDLLWHNGRKGLSFIFTSVVQKSVPYPGRNEQPNAPGTVAKIIWTLKPQYKETFWGNIKSLHEGIYGELPDKKTLKAAVDEDCQAARGMLVRFTTRDHKTDAGNMIVIPEFYPVSEEGGNTPDAILARRAGIEGVAVDVSLARMQAAMEAVEKKFAAEQVVARA